MPKITPKIILCFPLLCVEPNVHELDVCTKDYIDLVVSISDEVSEGIK